MVSGECPVCSAILHYGRQLATYLRVGGVRADKTRKMRAGIGKQHVFHE
jgi:hypothetical protein